MSTASVIRDGTDNDNGNINDPNTNYHNMGFDPPPCCSGNLSSLLGNDGVPTPNTGFSNPELLRTKAEIKSQKTTTQLSSRSPKPLNS